MVDPIIALATLRYCYVTNCAIVSIYTVGPLNKLLLLNQEVQSTLEMLRAAVR